MSTSDRQVRAHAGFVVGARVVVRGYWLDRLLHVAGCTPDYVDALRCEGHVSEIWIGVSAAGVVEWESFLVSFGGGRVHAFSAQQIETPLAAIAAGFESREAKRAHDAAGKFGVEHRGTWLDAGGVFVATSTPHTFDSHTTASDARARWVRDVSYKGGSLDQPTLIAERLIPGVVLRISQR